jgi:WD40 repeat protein
MSKLTEVMVLAAQPGTARGYAYNMYADGNKGDRLAYTNGKTVFLRSLENPSECTVFSGKHMGNTTVANFSPSGEWVASGDEHGRLLIWGAGSNQNVKSDFPINQGITDIVWSPDGKRVAACGAGVENLAKCVAWDTGSALGIIGKHTKKILSMVQPSSPFEAWHCAAITVPVVVN